MLTDSQIIELSKRMSIPLEGVYFKDEIPTPIKYNKVYILNLQDSIDDNSNENSGTHWTMLYIREYPKGKLEPIFFDPYGCPPSECIKRIITKQTKLTLPHTTKDIQSLMNNACGFYCLALGHYLTASKYASGDLYRDVDNFIDIFDDLNISIDWKKNEYILHNFFVSEDPSLRKPIDNMSKTHADYERIINEDEKGGMNLMKLPVNVVDMSKNKK